MRKSLLRAQYLLGFLLLLQACTSEDALMHSEADSVITFVATQPEKAQSRVTGNLWDEGDAIGLFMKKTGASLTPESVLEGAENKPYVTLTSAGSFTPQSGASIYYPSSEQTVDFIAYYPYNEAAASSYTYPVNVTNQQYGAMPNLLYANNLKAVSVGTHSPELRFYHQLSQLELQLTAGEGIQSLSGLSVTLKGTYSQATFDLKEGELQINTASVADVAVPLILGANGTTAVASALVLPAEQLNNASLLFGLNGKSYSVKLSNTTEFRAGSKRTYQITLKDSEVSDDTGSNELRWFETPRLTLGDESLHYVTHAMPEDDKVRNYSMLYDTKYKVAYWVAYPMHSYYLGNASRTDAWGDDPKIHTDLQPRLKSGFGETNIDRGHQLPSADRTSSSAANRTTFYYTNVTPQIGQGLNQSVWNNLEGQVRSWTSTCDTLYVVTGAMITTATDKTIVYSTDNDNMKVARPKYYYKALAKKKGNNYYTIGFRFDNKQYPSGTSYNSYRVTVAELEAETGFTFFPSLSSEVKGTIDSSQW
ncbi:MAG: fimbrillin family protein [Phocaeicola sp.]